MNYFYFAANMVQEVNGCGIIIYKDQHLAGMASKASNGIPIDSNKLVVELAGCDETFHRLQMENDGVDDIDHSMADFEYKDGGSSNEDNLFCVDGEDEYEYKFAEEPRSSHK